MIEKPVAFMYVNEDGECEEIGYAANESDDYYADQEWTKLFTESQLKAERERAIRECAELFTFNAKARILKLLDN